MLSAFGLDALVLFKRKKMAIFFLFSMLLGAALQITNTYGDLFLGSFASIPEYADSFGVKHSVILLSISQMSETLFILAIPFFLKHFGIKRVMLISMFAWVFRFGLFALGDPGSGLDVYKRQLKEPAVEQSCRMTLDDRPYYNPSAVPFCLEQPLSVPDEPTFGQRKQTEANPLMRIAPGYPASQTFSILFEAALNRTFEELENWKRGDDLRPLLYLLAGHCRCV